MVVLIDRGMSVADILADFEKSFCNGWEAEFCVWCRYSLVKCRCAPPEVAKVESCEIAKRLERTASAATAC